MSFTDKKTILQEIAEKQGVAMENAAIQMEQGCHWTGDMDVMAQVSLAISVKRIADFVCGSQKNSDVVDYLMKAMGPRQ